MISSLTLLNRETLIVMNVRVTNGSMWDAGVTGRNKLVQRVVFSTAAKNRVLLN